MKEVWEGNRTGWKEGKGRRGRVCGWRVGGSDCLALISSSVIQS